MKRALYSAVFLLSLVGAVAQAGTLTARDYFALLPATIFESTPEGLPDEEKRQLLESGRTDFWEVREETPDTFQVASVPFGETWVNLRVFRNDAPSEADKEGHGDVIALGTQGAAICSLELWRADARGRIVPVDTPAEPQVTEFFDGKSPLSKNERISILFCLENQGLEAVPLFWNQAGMLNMPVTNKVRYLWENGTFHKKTTPLAH